MAKVSKVKADHIPKMKEFKYKVIVVANITGRNEQDARTALNEWLERNHSEYQVMDFEEIGDAW